MHSREVKFYVVVQSTVGLSETAQQQLRVYPNPASDQLMIELPSEGMDELVVMDITGRTVLSQEIGAVQNVSLNLNTLESGIYHLVVRNGNDYLYAKFVVK
jgi:hypothetical protein